MSNQIVRIEIFGTISNTTFIFSDCDSESTRVSKVENIFSTLNELKKSFSNKRKSCGEEEETPKKKRRRALEAYEKWELERKVKLGEGLVPVEVEVKPVEVEVKPVEVEVKPVEVVNMTLPSIPFDVTLPSIPVENTTSPVLTKPDAYTWADAMVFRENPQGQLAECANYEKKKYLWQKFVRKACGYTCADCRRVTLNEIVVLKFCKESLEATRTLDKEKTLQVNRALLPLRPKTEKVIDLSSDETEESSEDEEDFARRIANL